MTAWTSEPPREGASTNPIIGSITVSAPFEREGRRYDATVTFDLHADGQRSLRKQDVTSGVYIVHDQDFEEDAYALMHGWDTRELEIEVEQLKRELVPLQVVAATAVDAFDFEKKQHAAHGGYGSGPKEPELIAALRAALKVQEASRG